LKSDDVKDLLGKKNDDRGFKRGRGFGGGRVKASPQPVALRRRGGDRNAMGGGEEMVLKGLIRKKKKGFPKRGGVKKKKKGKV